MLGNPRRDAREAYLLSDVASAHDAGLSNDLILNGPSLAGDGQPVASGSTLGSGLARGGLARKARATGRSASE